MLNHVIRPTVQPLGYRAVRADEIGEPGYINDHVIRLLNEAPLVIADLFGNNPNVFYEMAVRHTLGKPLIPIAEKGALIPFDVRGIRTVFIDIRDLESVAKAQGEMRVQIEAFERSISPVVNPVTRVVGPPEV
jgi:hypothetical protein